MKYLIITFFISFSSIAEIKKLDPRLRGMSLERARELQGTRTYKKKGKRAPSRLKAKERQKLRFKPYFAKTNLGIKTLDQFYVLINGNLKVMGGAVARVKVLALDKRFPKGSYFSCESYNSAIQYHYRLKFNCNKLVTPKKEYEVKAHIKDLKLISGITPDHVSTSEEEGLVKQFVMGLTAYMLESDKQREQTVFGQRDLPNDSNALRNAAIDGVQRINSDLSEANAKTLVLAMEGQKKAVIEFLAPFDFKGKNNETF